MSPFWQKIKDAHTYSYGTLWLLGGASILVWIGSLDVWMQGKIENPWLGGVAWCLAIGWIIDLTRTQTASTPEPRISNSPLQESKTLSTSHLNTSNRLFKNQDVCPQWSIWVLFWITVGLSLTLKGISDVQSAFIKLSLSQYDGQGFLLYTQGVCLTGGGIWCTWKGWIISFLKPTIQAQFFFPMCVFSLTLPWEALIHQWNQPLQEEATDLAIFMLDSAYALGWVDFKVQYWDSYTFYSDRFYLIINETCSGINLLISMSLYTLGFAWITQSNQKQSLWLLAYTLPLCLIFNALRIVMIFLLGHYGDRELAMGPWHEGSGYCVQLFFFILLAFLRFSLLNEKKMSV